MIILTENIKSRSVNLPLCDLVRLYKYKNKSEIIRKALDIFIEREKGIEKDTKQKEINESIVSFGMEIGKVKYLESICLNTKTDSRRYFSVSEIVRIALRDFWKIEDKLEKIRDHELIKPEHKKTPDYLERNGIKVIKVLDNYN